jgi:hypothetical protein
MNRDDSKSDPTLALNTVLEREFVTPLTSIRGVLEIIHDFPDLSIQDRNRFLNNALRDCARLELGIEQLASRVYATGDRVQQAESEAKQEDSSSEYGNRINFLEKLQIAEIDFSKFEFDSSKTVNEFYDLLDQLIENTGQRWYIIVNYHECSIWPEAWVAFAHRGKKVNLSYSLGTVRYIEQSGASDDSTLLNDPELLASRDKALARIDELRTET